MTLRSDLPVTIEFGLKLRHIAFLFAFLMVLLALYFHAYADFTRLDFAVGVFLVCAVVALAIWILAFYKRSYGSGRIVLYDDRIVVDGSRRHHSDYVRDCSAFALSKTSQEISWDVAIDAIKVHRSIGGLKCSRTALIDLVERLNRHVAEVRGERVEIVPAIGPAATQSVPLRFRGKRMGRDAIYRYAMYTTLTTGAVAFASLFIFGSLLAASDPSGCSEPRTRACLVVSATLSMIFLTLLFLVPLAVLLWRRYRGVASRIRDLDELPTVGAVLVAMVPFTPSRTRIVTEYGTPGPNRFGPAPE